LNVEKVYTISVEVAFGYIVPVYNVGTCGNMWEHVGTCGLELTAVEGRTFIVRFMGVEYVVLPPYQGKSKYSGS
jgi:hypothetical protein